MVKISLDHQCKSLHGINMLSIKCIYVCGYDHNAIKDKILYLLSLCYTLNKGNEIANDNDVFSWECWCNISRR